MATLSSINNRFVSVLYFEAFDFEALDGIANSLQQPDFLVHQTIQGVFVKLCNGNSYDEFNSPVGDMEKTDFKFGGQSYNCGQFSSVRLRCFNI